MSNDFSRPISVVMAVYNMERYVGEAIESILDQTFKEFEFIVVDDQSTDSSYQIIQKYAALDSRIVSVKNNGKKGYFSARNLGFDLMKGKYYAVMDADDVSLPKRLEKQFDFMEKNPDVDICGSWATFFGHEEGLLKFPTTRDEIRDSLFFYNCIVHPTVIMRKKSLDKFNIKYSDSFLFAQDYELWCREIDRLKFANIPEILLKYRKHDRSKGHEERAAVVEMALKDIISKNGLKNGLIFNESEIESFFNAVYGKINFKSADEVEKTLFLFDKISRTAGKNYGDVFKNLLRNKTVAVLNSSCDKWASLNLYLLFNKLNAFNGLKSKIKYLIRCFFKLKRRRGK